MLELKTMKNTTNCSHLPCNTFKAMSNFNDTTENFQLLNSNIHNSGKRRMVSGAKNSTMLEACLPPLLVSHVLGKDLGVAVFVKTSVSGRCKMADKFLLDKQE